MHTYAPKITYFTIVSHGVRRSGPDRRTAGGLFGEFSAGPDRTGPAVRQSGPLRPGFELVAWAVTDGCTWSHIDAYGCRQTDMECVFTGLHRGRLVACGSSCGLWLVLALQDNAKREGVFFRYRQTAICDCMILQWWLIAVCRMGTHNWIVDVNQHTGTLWEVGGYIIYIYIAYNIYIYSFCDFQSSS